MNDFIHYHYSMINRDFKQRKKSSILQLSHGTSHVSCVCRVDELITFDRHIAYMTYHKNIIFFSLFLFSLSLSHCLWCGALLLLLFRQGVVPCRVQEFPFRFLSCSIVFCFVLHVSSSCFHQSEFISSSCNSSVTANDIVCRAVAANVYIWYIRHRNWLERKVLPYRISYAIVNRLKWSFKLFI